MKWQYPSSFLFLLLLLLLFISVLLHISPLSKILVLGQLSNSKQKTTMVYLWLVPNKKCGEAMLGSMADRTEVLKIKMFEFTLLSCHMSWRGKHIFETLVGKGEQIYLEQRSSNRINEQLFSWGWYSGNSSIFNLSCFINNLIQIMPPEDMLLSSHVWVDCGLHW